MTRVTHTQYEMEQPLPRAEELIPYLIGAVINTQAEVKVLWSHIIKSGVSIDGNRYAADMKQARIEVLEQIIRDNSHSSLGLWAAQKLKKLKE